MLLAINAEPMQAAIPARTSMSGGHQRQTDKAPAIAHMGKA